MMKKLLNRSDALATDRAPSDTAGGNTKSNQQANFKAQFAECLNLLQGPTDERRFVGLLLVTKLLPNADNDSIKRVYEAIGPTFVSRLLLALKTKKRSPYDPPSSSPTIPVITTPEAFQKQVGTVALGVAVLAAFTQLPDIAADPEIVENLPLMLKVIEAGGVGAALRKELNTTTTIARGGGDGDGNGSLTGVEATTETAAVQDALESVVAIATATAEGSKLARLNGALRCVVDILQKTGDKVEYEMKLRALRLAWGVLSPPDFEERHDILNECGDQIEALIPHLAQIFSGSTTVRRFDSPKTPLPTSTSHDAGQNLAGHAATLQLEALSLLLLIFPVPDSVFPLYPNLLNTAAGSTWAVHIRNGLSILLRSKIGATHRHGALQLAAGVSELAGPAWLAGDGAKFFQLLTEITKIEVGVLLLDALAPEVPVPSSSKASKNVDTASPAAAVYNPPQPQTMRHTNSDLGVPMDTTTTDAPNSTSNGSPDMESLRRALQGDDNNIDDENQKEDQGPFISQRPPDPGSTQKKVDSIQIPTDMTWTQSPSETAGDRASRVLPICFTLLETEIDVLVGHEEESLLNPHHQQPNSAQSMAMDSTPSDEDQEDDDDDRLGMERQVSTGSYSTLSTVGSSRYHRRSFNNRGMENVVLPDDVADRGMHSIHEAIEAVLQFLEQVHEVCKEKDNNKGTPTSKRDGGDVGNSDGKNNSSDDVSPVVVGAVRAVCRFCAEAPDAFSTRIRALAPWMINITIPAPPLPPTAMPTPPPPAFFPKNKQQTQQQTDNAPQYGNNDSSSSEDTSNRGGSNEEEQGPKEYVGALFMLPMLLQVSHQDWAANVTVGADGTETFATNNSTGNGGGSTDPITDFRQEEQRQWFALLRRSKILRPLLLLMRSSLEEAAVAVTSAVEDAAHSKVTVLCEFLLRIINYRKNDEFKSPFCTVPSLEGRKDLSRGPAALILNTITDSLTRALRQAVMSGKSSFNRRATKSNRPKIQTNRMIACGGALLSELWLIAHERNVEMYFDDFASVLTSSLLSALHLGTACLSHLDPQSQVYTEVKEWTEIMIAAMHQLRCVSVEFDSLCERSDSLAAAMSRGASLMEDEVVLMLEELQQPHSRHGS